MRLTTMGLGGLVIGFMAACMPKGMAEDSGASAEDTGGAAESTSAGETGGETGVTSGPSSTGVVGECTPGDTKPGPLDCGEDCECSSEGQWECPVVFACSETGPGTSASTTTESSTGETTAGGETAGDTTGETTPGETGDTTGGGVVIDLPQCEKLAPSDEFELDKAAVAGDALHIEVTYGGGCEKHDFVLCQLGFKDDVILLGIDHDAHGDLCDALVMDSRDLDLKALQVLPSPVLLSLEDWPVELEYAF